MLRVSWGKKSLLLNRILINEIVVDGRGHRFKTNNRAQLQHSIDNQVKFQDVKLSMSRVWRTMRLLWQRMLLYMHCGDCSGTWSPSSSYIYSTLLNKKYTYISLTSYEECFQWLIFFKLHSNIQTYFSLHFQHYTAAKYSRRL